MIKLRAWEIMLIKLVVIPILCKVRDALKEYAEGTDTQVDDHLAGIIDVLINALQTDGTIVAN